jgi:hypothetical protein
MSSFLSDIYYYIRLLEKGASFFECEFAPDAEFIRKDGTYEWLPLEIFLVAEFLCRGWRSSEKTPKAGREGRGRNLNRPPAHGMGKNLPLPVELSALGPTP